MKIIHDETLEIDIQHHVKTDDQRITALYELAYSFMYLCRLGISQKNKKIILELDGYLQRNLIPNFSKFIRKMVTARSMIKYNCLLKEVSVSIISRGNNSMDKYSLDNKKCLLLFSTGLDSLVAKEILKKKFHLKLFHIVNGSPPIDKILRSDDQIIKYKDKFPAVNNKFFKTYNDSFDNDPWNDYGKYFLYLIHVLKYALKNGYKYLALGLNEDDLFDYDIVSGKKIHSQCCQSFIFIKMMKNVLYKLFRIHLVIPLEKMNRMDIAKFLIANRVELKHSKSCIFKSSAECGQCFSCYDKITSILAVLNPEKVGIIISKKTIITYNGKKLMGFKSGNIKSKSLEQLPMDHISTILLNRILLGEDINIIYSSKFSVKNLLSLFNLYDKKHKIIKNLFPKSSGIFHKNRKFFSNVRLAHP